MNSLLAKGRPAEILHVEDDEGVAELTREMFRRTKQPVHLHHARDGEECMAFLRKQGKFAGSPSPDIILLDLNMPRMDGYEVMQELLKDGKLRHVPVVILTTSADNEEILRMYQLRCNSYIVKPVGMPEYLHTIETFCQYWLTVVALPSAP